MGVNRYLTIPWHRWLPLVVLFATMMISAGLVAGRAVSGMSDFRPDAGFWVMAVLAVLLDIRPFTVLRQRDVLVAFPSVALIFAILLAYGLGPAIVVQTVTIFVVTLMARVDLVRALWRLIQYIVAYGMAELVLVTGQLHPFPAGERLGIRVLVLLAAVVAWFGVQFTTSTMGVWLRDGGTWSDLMNRALGWESVATAAILLIGSVLAAVAETPSLIPLAVLPLYVIFRLGRFDEDLQLLSRHDMLTGLMNRGAFLREVARRIREHTNLAAQGEEASHLGLIVLDVDRFQGLNEALGHEVGDQLLAEIARRLRAAAGPYDLVARVGGDEFAVLVPYLTGAADARAVAGRMVAVLDEPIQLGELSQMDELTLDVSASVGVAVFPEHGQNLYALLRRADAALHDAKQRVALVSVYHPEYDQGALRRLSLLADLRAALESPKSGGLTLYYQPQVALDTGEVVGVEALLRWNHPQHGPISPAEVIEAAEHTNVMQLLTLKVVDDAVAQIAKWRAAGVRLRVAINVSIRDLRTGEVAERLAQQLRRHSLTAGDIQLEITEGALMADPRRVMATLAGLARLGVAISLDDFGTGYSSLQHLRRMPLSEVKIDRSFVAGMTRDADDAAIVEMTVHLGRALGLRVVAEGVEDEPTWRRLAALGCQVGQGWFFARPMPAEELLPWLARFPPRPAPGFQTEPVGGRHQWPENGQQWHLTDDQKRLDRPAGSGRAGPEA